MTPNAIVVGSGVTIGSSGVSSEWISPVEVPNSEAPGLTPAAFGVIKPALDSANKAGPTIEANAVGEFRTVLTAAHDVPKFADQPTKMKLAADVNGTVASVDVVAPVVEARPAVAPLDPSSPLSVQLSRAANVVGAD